MHHCHQLPRGVPRALLAGWITAVAYACTLMYAAMPTTTVSTPPNNATVRRRVELWSAIDRGADPCRSFYAYACGNYAEAVGPSAFERAGATARAAFDDLTHEVADGAWTRLRLVYNFVPFGASFDEGLP